MSSYKCINSKINFSLISGLVFGTIVTLPTAGLLCGLDTDGGWPFIFYISGQHLDTGSFIDAVIVR